MLAIREEFQVPLKFLEPYFDLILTHRTKIPSVIWILMCNFTLKLSCLASQLLSILFKQENQRENILLGIIYR